MRKNTKRLIALLMTITMILAVCPVEIFAAGDDTAVSTVPAAVTDSADTAEDTLAPEEASASEDVTVTESEAPVSAEQSEAAAPQQTSANATALQKSSGLLPAPALRFQKSSAAAFYPIAFASGQGTTTLINDFYTTSFGSGGNPITPTGSGSLKIKTGTRLISSASDWNEFADAVLAGETFENYLVKLTDDITVTRGIGSGNLTSATDPVYPFSGTFDGCGHTLNFVPSADTEANYVAPFSIVKNATVTNLKVTGKVTAYNNISGLVGSLIGTLLIENVISDVDVSGNFVGGFIGHGSAGNITVRNSAYTGDLNGSTLAGGIICWRGPTAWDPSGVSAVHMENCLFAGRAIGTADFHPIGFTQQTNVPSGFTNMWSSVSPKNNSKGFYNYQYQGASYKPTVAVVTSKSDTSGTRPWMGYYDVTAFMPTEGALAEALNAWTGAEKLFLLGDATANTTATVPSGEHTLDLNGHELKRTGATGSDNSGLVITVGDGVNLTVTGPGKITGGSGFHGGGIHVEGNSSLVLDNCEISGNTGHYGGGLYLKNGTITLKNGTAVKNNSATEGFGGSGIYAEGSGTLILEGGTFTNNEIRNNNQYAVFLAGNANAQISGAPVIYDNKYGSTQKNLYMFQAGNQHSIVRIAGALTDGAKIGVGQTTVTGEITSGWKDKMGNANPSKYFTSDNNSYSVFLNANDEAEIGVPPAARIISGEVTTNYGSISDAVGAWTAGSTLKLLSDVTTGSTITVPSGAHTLDLNGHGITMTGSGSVINVGSSAVLNVYDCGETEHKFTVNSPASNGAGLAVVDDTLTSGYKTFTGGYITGGNAQDGAGVYVTGGGKFNMYGGTILGNLSSRHGGGVNVSMSSDGSEFNMYGGSVCYNSAVWGGGINIFATARVSGESLIENNVASNGGGIELESGGRLYMNGGTVTENRVLAQNGGMWMAGGIHVPNGTEYHLQGAVRVINNYEGASGTTQNNVFVRKEVPGKVILDGALAADASIGAGTNGAAPFTLTSAYNTHMGDADPAKYFTSDNADYTVILKDGEAALEYPPVPDISASGYTGDYDGAAHSIAVSVPTGATVQYGTKEGEYSLTENPSYTGAGTYNVYYKVTMDKHTPVEGSAVVTINQISVTVTITGHNTTVDYDGKAHSADGYDFAADTTLYTAADFTFSGRAEAVQTDAGTATMGLAASQFENTNENFATVTFNVTDGFVKINPIDVTVTITGHTVTANYDGKAHSVEGYDFAADSTLYTEADFTFSGNAAAERTDVGTTQMGIAASQFENTNENFATVTFNVTDGFVKINPIDVTVTITGHTVTSDYDGKAHSVEGYDFAADSTLYTEADFTFSGIAAAQRTDAGKTDMGLTAAQFENTNENFATVTFHVTDGFVKIDPIDVTVTITGHRTTVDFNAETHSADGYDFATDNALYTAADFTFDGRAEALRTNAGTTYMGLTASQFKNTNKNFATVVFDVRDGFVKVNQINAVVTITGQYLTADYDGNTHSVAGYEFESDTPLYTAAYVTFSGNAAAERREAGTTQMGLAAAQFANTNENFTTVTFHVKDGYVTINPITAVVTVTGHTNTAPYDGKAHIVSGYDALANTALYDVEKDFAFTGSANAVQTDAGTAKMGLSSAQFKNTNPNFASVIFKVTDGWQKITRVDASIKSAPHAKNNLVYSGDTQALIVPGTAVGGTLYYAIGANDTTVPAGAQFKQTLPAAKEVGNYYIWYKVVADKNHNSLAPKCFKVTLAEPAWESISGKILNNDNTPAPGAKVILMRGNEVVDTITSNENGEYYFTVPKGVYNMVVKVNGVTVTSIADVTGNVNSLITLPAPNTDSVLDIVSSDKSIAVGGLEQEASLIRKNENIPDDVNVTVKMTVQAIAESDTDGSKAITSFAKDKYIEFYNLSVEKTIGSVTTKMNTTQTVMEIVIPCSFTNKRELQVFTCDGGDVTALTESDSGEPGTYRVDAENGLIYIYTTSFATVALAYQPYFSVTSFLSLGSYTGSVSVKLEKESGDKIFELNDVSVEDIAFKGVPRGTYTMTVQWVDGVENTITMPFNIK